MNQMPVQTAPGSQNFFPPQNFSNPIPDLPATSPAPPVMSETPSSLPVVPPDPKQIKESKKGLIAFFVLFVLVAGGLGTFIFSQTKNVKAEIKGQGGKQVNNFSQLENTYGEILAKIKSATQEDSGKSNQLLGAQSQVVEIEGKKVSLFPAVLGLEDEPGLILLRSLGELYNQGVKTSQEIKTLNQEIEKRVTNKVFAWFLPKPSSLFEETSKFSQETTSLLNYFKTSNSFEIKLYTLGFEVGMSINEAIVRGADETGISNLEKKINELDSAKEEYLAIDTTFLPDSLIKAHLDGLKGFEEDKKIFVEILNSLKNRIWRPFKKVFSH